MQDDLKYFCSKLSRFVVGTEGNLSQRVDGGFVIKKSGTSFDDARFVPCDMNGNSLSNEKPSMEASFHAFIYQNSDYKFIAHTHPVNTLKILCGEKEKMYFFAGHRYFPDQVVFNGAYSCVVPYVMPGQLLTDAIAKAVQEHQSFPSLFLLQNHGIICCAHSIKQAIIMTEICEKAAEIFLAINPAHYLNPEQVSEIQCHPDEVFRKQQ